MNMNISSREYVEFLENKFSKKKKFIDNYKFISKYLQITSQNLSYSKAIKKITNIVFKCKDKFEELAPKVYFDYYETFIKENYNIIDEDFLMKKK